ncbi:MAG: accessory gene regulator B family protein [Coprococcus sp.]|nr:accessory gene regulator B family protein [Coprococcus sp.]
MYKNNAILYDDIELYEYAIYSILYSTFPLVVFLFICIIFKKLLVGILIVAPFISIRRYSGGYHAPTSILCFIYSITTLLAILLLSQCDIPSVIIIALIIPSYALLSLYSPIENKNHPISNIEKKIYNKRTISICFLWIIVCFILNHFFSKQLFMACALSIILSSLSIIPCIKKGR